MNEQRCSTFGVSDFDVSAKIKNDREKDRID